MITLRNWRAEDAETLAALARNEKIAENLREKFPAAEKYIAENLVDGKNISRAVEWNGELAGCISLTLDDFILARNAEIGCWLGEIFWNRGIATAAVAQICDAGFKNFALDRIYAGVFENNLAAVKVLERSGFKFEARLENAVCKNGRLLDALLYGRVNDEKNSTDNHSGDAERQWQDHDN